MTKYYNANQVHKYGYRPQFVMPSKEESIRMAQEAAARLEKSCTKILRTLDILLHIWYNIIKRKVDWHEEN